MGLSWWGMLLLSCSLGGVYYPEVGSGGLTWTPAPQGGDDSGGGGDDTGDTDTDTDTEPDPGDPTILSPGTAPCDEGDGETVALTITNETLLSYELTRIFDDCSEGAPIFLGAEGVLVYSSPAGSHHRARSSGINLFDFRLGTEDGELAIQ